MSLPLAKLVDYEGNIYQMTCAAIREADLLSQPDCGGKEIEQRNEKIVTAVLDKALDDEIEFTHNEE